MNFSFVLPSASNFGKAKVTKKSREEQNKSICFFCAGDICLIIRVAERDNADLDAGDGE